MEEVGAYFSLLNRQMIDGYVNLDDMDQMIFVLHQNFKTREEAEAKVRSLLSPIVRDRFPAVEDHPGRYVNLRLAEVMAETDAASIKNKMNVEKRYATSAINGPIPVFDFKPIIEAYPRLKMAPSEPSRINGIRLMEMTITTQEDYDKLLAAVKNFSNQMRGRKAHHIRNFDTFLSTWTSYIPPHLLELKQDPQAPAIVVEATPVATDFPWEEREMDTESAKKRKAEYWTEERKQQYLSGNDPRKDHPMSGAN
jgi:hypothetical protein